MAAPRDPSEPAYDWQDLSASIQRRLRFHLRGWPDAEVDDAAQDVLYKVLRFLDRSGAPDNLDGLVTVIARRTAVERIRARSRRPAHEPVAEHSVATPDDSARRELAELEEQAAWRAFLVIEFFREKHAPCVELAEARAHGVDFKVLSERTKQSHLALLQRWSRCMRRLRAAIDEGLLPWDGPEGRT